MFGAGESDWNGTYDFVGTNCEWRGNGCKNNYQKGSSAFHIFRNNGGYWYLDQQNVGTKYRVAFNNNSDTPPTTGWQVVGNASSPAPTLVVNHSGWAQEAYIKASNSNNGDYFSNVSLYGDTLAVGAGSEDSNQTTITNDNSTASSDNSNSGSGAVYVYRLSLIHI